MLFHATGIHHKLNGPFLINILAPISEGDTDTQCVSNLFLPPQLVDDIFYTLFTFSAPKSNPIECEA